MVEQDHHFIKRLVKPGMGFFSFPLRFFATQALCLDDIQEDENRYLRENQVVEGYEESENRATVLSYSRSFFMACYDRQMAGKRLFKAITYARLRLRCARNSALSDVLDICWSSASMASSPRCSLKFESMRRIVTTAR